MNKPQHVLLALAFGLLGSTTCLAADHFVSPSGGNVAPFTSWDTAATDIQSAIDAASAGEVVWVTNGVYATGGKAMAGDLTNRVSLDKALTVQSVNGPVVTTIQGAWDNTSSGNGPLAVRCAWLTNGAMLSGFTLQGGATRATSGSNDAQQRGGGVYGTNRSIVVNCVIRGNSANYSGGGAEGVSLLRCALLGNALPSSNGLGGGANGCNATNCTFSRNYSANWGGGGSASILRNCAVSGNMAVQYGGGVYSSVLVNCTVVSNTVGTAFYAGIGGGVYSTKLTNCIVFANQDLSDGWVTTSNYYSSTFTFCCTAPLPAGNGNIGADPQLLSDGIHLEPSSPCSAVGLASAVRGTDIDGQPWANPPSIGCDQWLPAPVFAGPPQLGLVGSSLGLSLWAFPVGQGPFTCFWLKDGVALADGGNYGSTQTTNLIVSNFGPANTGAYQLVASNAFGMATSAVAMVAAHFVDAAGANSTPPYSDWSTAATTIQDAIDAAAPGDFVLVTNGVYASGGRVMAGDLTNRVAVNKTLTVTSINGAGSTFIVGRCDPTTTNGPLATRCAWLSAGATLRGFTLQGGATRNSGDTLRLQSGGGVWCLSTNESVVGCVISNNAAAYGGGGSYQGLLQRSIIWGNRATSGGGAYQALLTSCLVSSNTASQMGGGLYYSTFYNCTVTANTAPGSMGGGVYGSFGKNSIVFYNTSTSHGLPTSNDWESRMNLISCWTTTNPNDYTTPAPQVIDGVHLAATSPCRGAGNSLYVTGTDFDGEPWLNPPSIGCDEFYESDYTGPIVLGPIVATTSYGLTPVVRNASAILASSVSGKAERVAWSFGDGASLTNSYLVALFHTWTNTGDFNVTFAAYNADNPAGVSTNVIVHVVPPDPPVISGASRSGTSFNLTFAGIPGVTYYLDRTTNLSPPSVWQTVATTFGSMQTTTATDSSATNSMSFYRVRPK